MEIVQNLHTHTDFCDGKDSMEAMVRQAVNSGLSSLGFSSHYPPFADPGAIKPDKIDEYFSEIARLKHEYRNEIKLFAGFEIDKVDDSKFPLFDKRCQFTIGSVHRFIHKDEIIYIDSSPELFQKALQHFGNNPLELAKSYYEQVAEFSYLPYTITGHFDLISKFNEKYHFFNEEDKNYRDIALQALETVVKNGKVIEINTGAISRGWKTKPYPALFLLKRAKELNAPITVGSDAHKKESITQSFDYCAELLESLGYSSLFLLD